MDINTYITSHHLVENYLSSCKFSKDVAEIIVKKYGQNNIIVLTKDNVEIYNGDVNIYFTTKIQDQVVDNVIGATGAFEPNCIRVPPQIVVRKPKKLERSLYPKLSQQKETTLAVFKAKRLAKKQKKAKQ